MGRKWGAADGLLTVANIFGCAAIVILAASIGTDRWLVFTVDRTKLTTGSFNGSKTGVSALYHHTRERGMWRECYPGTDTIFLDKAEGVVDKNCFMLKLVDTSAGASSEYKLKIGLHTAFVSMFIVGEIFLVIAYIVGLLLCIGKCFKNAWFAAIVCFFSAFLFSLGMALFHGSFYVETEDTIVVPADRPEYKMRWPADLKAATTVDYKESYAVAWAGIVLVLITCVCYIFAARTIRKPKRESKQGLDNYAYGYPQQEMTYPSGQQPYVYYVA